MKIRATPVKGSDLKPGDLFSTASQEYWDNPNPGSVGEKVYIRMDTPAEWYPDFDAYVYKITVEKDGELQISWPSGITEITILL